MGLDTQPVIALIGIAIFLVVVLVSATVTTINAGHVGVVKRFGAVQDKSLHEGLHFVVPFVNTVAEIDTRLATVAYSSLASSSDIQTISTEVSVQYFLQSNIPELYQNIGTRANIENAVIIPGIQESVKAIISKYSAKDLILKRKEVKNAIQASILSYIKSSLQSKQIDATSIRISNCAMTDFQFSDEFNTAIEQKVRAEQLALQSLNEKKQRITQAEAKKQEKQLAADAASYEIEKMSMAQAAAIKRESQALKGNPALIQLRYVEKWDGVLPVYQSGGKGPVPIMDVGGLGKGRSSRNVHEKRRIQA